LVAGAAERGLVDNEVMGKPKASKKKGATRTDAAIRSREARLRGPARPIDWKKIEAIQKEIAALPVLDSRTADEILGSDEFGLPS
jgi:antitoxin VapB